MTDDKETRNRLADELAKEMGWLTPNIRGDRRAFYKMVVDACVDIVRNGRARDRKDEG